VATPPRRPAGLSALETAGLVLVAVALPALVLRAAMELRRAAAGIPLEAAHHLVSRDVVTLAAAQALGFGVAIALGVGLAKRPNLAVRSFLGALPAPAPWLLLGCAIGLALPFPLQGLGYLLYRAVPELAPEAATQLERWNRLRIEGLFDAVAIPLAVVAVPSVMEELFFRGLLLPSLDRRYGRTAALAATSVLFGLVHLEPVTVVLAALAGWLLGEVRLRTDSIWPGVALHGAFNAVPVLLGPSLVSIPGFNSPSIEPMPWPLLLGGLVVAGGCTLVLFRWTDIEP
jgi:membrane protease YdiL (CAAX protease family)